MKFGHTSATTMTKKTLGRMMMMKNTLGRTMMKLLGLHGKEQQRWYRVLETNSLRDGDAVLQVPKLHNNERLQRLLKLIGVMYLALPHDLLDDEWWQRDDLESLREMFSHWTPQKFKAYCCFWQALYGWHDTPSVSRLIDLMPDGHNEGTGEQYSGEPLRIDATDPVVNVSMEMDEWAPYDDLLAWISDATHTQINQVLAELAPEAEAIESYVRNSSLPLRTC